MCAKQSFYALVCGNPTEIEDKFAVAGSRLNAGQIDSVRNMFNPNRGETRADGVPHEAAGRDEFPDLLVTASGLVETRLCPKQQPVLERMAPTSMSQDTFETCRRTFGTGLTVPYLRIDRT